MSNLIFEDLGYSVSTRVSQTRLIFEWIRLYLKDPSTPFEVHYKACRELVNQFIEQHKSSAPLDVCFKDVKTECRVTNADTLDELINIFSWEKDGFSAAILYLENPSDWIKTVALIKKSDSAACTLVDPKSGVFTVCPDLLDQSVKKLLSEPEARFGYVLVFFKKEEPKVEVEEEKKPASVKKRHRPVAKKKKGVVGEVTSEESTNK